MVDEAVADVVGKCFDTVERREEEVPEEPAADGADEGEGVGKGFGVGFEDSVRCC